MTSRLTLTAALFAIVTTGSFAFAAGVRTVEPVKAATVKVVQLERVVISAKREVASL